MYFTPALLLSLTSLVAAQVCVDPRRFEGSATVYFPAGISACGNTNIPQKAFVAGLPAKFFDGFQTGNDTNPNDNPVCGRTITVSGDNNLKTIEATVVERRGGGGDSDILLSPAAFEVLADSDSGNTPVHWFLNPTTNCK